VLERGQRKDAIGKQGLGNTPEARQLAYKAMFERLTDDHVFNLIRHTTQKGGIFGNKIFIKKTAKLTGREVVLRSKGRPKKSL